MMKMMMKVIAHQYIHRESGSVRTERLYGDWLLNTLYVSAWESAPTLYRLLTSARFSRLLGLFCYDSLLGSCLSGNQRFLRACQVDLTECIDPPEQLDTARKIFERRIRYWERRPLPDDPAAIVSPADARMLVGSFRGTSRLFLKGKFFGSEELLDPNKKSWVEAFTNGDFAVFRLTPDKYHYNHTPVAGVVRDFYEIPGGYHPCNPGLVFAAAFPYAKNKRVVTIFDTDTPGGSSIGLVAMIEIVALMIGDIVQCYSEERYHNPCALTRGMFLRKGQPKSLYRPGSSTTVLLFQQDRVQFADDLLRNLFRAGVRSRFSQGLGRSLVETEVKVRSGIAVAAPSSARGGGRYGVDVFLCLSRND
ncbi:MAG: phosphatidylserine decarboxylase [Candidatus Binatia bacterium]